MTDPQLPIDFEAARRRRDLGMARAENRAERNIPGWRDEAASFLRSFAIVNEQFTAEEVIEASRDHGVPDPPDRRAWGPIFQAASRAGSIERVGYAPARTSNMSPKPLWRLKAGS